MMSASKRVYITTGIARRAEVYHTDPDCNTTTWSDITEIAQSTADRHRLDVCGTCSGEGLNEAQQKLLEMDPDDLPIRGGEA